MACEIVLEKMFNKTQSDGKKKEDTVNKRY